METQKKLDKNFSCEFFPPKTDKGMENLLSTAETLKNEINPEFFSVTFGAGGSTRETTFNAVTKIQQSTGCDVAPHLSCIGSSKQQLKDILDDYKNQGIKRIVTLRGDMPSGTVSQSDFNYANELVGFIRDNYNDQFHIEVAAYPETHPQAENANQDMLNFKNKVLSGADSAITQYFYNIDSYFYFIDNCEKAGLDLPIVPGIMPITNYSNLARFSDMCGAEIPRWLRRKLESYADDTDSIKEFGADFVSSMCQKLLEMGAPGLHFYSMNQSEATLKIWNNLKL
ncbi:MAG: methylenetetrahydrofolate reductase [NAD(P)H] [endosymbiont of Galathealinum brachiosum]|uniref:Methylenetetrahydrofolate reductase n=1 Tax=endosymbiont of Galathealinum brachiosum TaxID=2200906 RepID=A0A370DDI5_9GAMM|nr:MAG: methylenetetrahydrofolate reductase [NAD(P)H] [endosymbiont of Galathealinum brachiosum]